MKQLLLIKLIKEVLLRRISRKTLALVAGVAFVAILAGGAALLWGVTTGISYLSRTLNQGSTVQQSIQTAAQDAVSRPLFKPGCLEALNTHLRPTAWLETPVEQTVSKIKIACIRNEAEKASPTNTSDSTNLNPDRAKAVQDRPLKTKDLSSTPQEV
ncbi:MAG: hypothetical protein KGQ59_00630 [Bdellovibrionales bacterium]|nr:hypothetical protein [Bdellovibrionales bacterium]